MSAIGDGEGVRVYLLRHGEVSSHGGDVPITSAARKQAADTGSWLAACVPGVIAVLCGETRRAQETAEHLREGIEKGGGGTEGPTVAHALRNPDLYLAGYRVNMVSSHDAFAAQVPGLEAGEVADLDFYSQFVAAPDRIGWWLQHADPPGEGASSVAARIRAFARSLTNPYRPERRVFAAVTHSPLLRAVGLDALGYDIGEPDWISGLVLEVDVSGEIDTIRFPGAS